MLDSSFSGPALHNSPSGTRAIMEQYSAPSGDRSRRRVAVAGGGVEALVTAYVLAAADGGDEVLLLGDWDPGQYEGMVVAGGGVSAGLLDLWVRAADRSLPQLAKELVDLRLERCPRLWVAYEPWEVAGLRRACETARLHGQPARWLEAAEAAKLCPPLAGGAVAAAFYLPDGFAVRGDELAAVLMGALRQRGVRFVPDGMVHGAAGGAKIEVRVADGPVACQRIILAGEAVRAVGPWSQRQVLCGRSEAVFPDLAMAVLHPASGLQVVPTPAAGVFFSAYAPRGDAPDAVALAARLLKALPGMGRVPLARYWRRPLWAAPDGVPAIGPWDGDGVWLNAGWDGLAGAGVATALELAGCMAGQEPWPAGPMHAARLAASSRGGP